jgi:hypothetical protein
LRVGGSLFLNHSQNLTKLSTDLNVGGSIELSDCYSLVKTHELMSQLDDLEKNGHEVIRPTHLKYPIPNQREVLVLIGDIPLAEWGEKHSFWSQTFSDLPDINVTFTSLEDFHKTPPAKETRYELIIIDTHGVFTKNAVQISGKQHRQGHIVSISKDATEETDPLLLECAQYSDKILLSSC